jgi:hypothetical protein
MNENSSEGLATLDDGQVPETRMGNALATLERIQVLLRAEQRGRSPRRALLKGLVDGNPPYRVGDMVRAGRANACNVNWRVAEYYINHARSAFYDIFSESPTYATIRTDFGNPNQREQWSQIITEEFDRMLRQDKTWDYCMAISQYEMILYGIGPIVFEDDENWGNRAFLCRDLVVPDFTVSDTTQWEEAVLLKDYNPHDLYNFIRKESIASEMGWDVEETKKAIISAHPKTQEGGQYRAWEWHQQQLKNQSFNYTSQSKVIACVHYLFREFPLPGESLGRISHCILVNPQDQQTAAQDKYLFKHIGRFKDWDEVIHPMYYDNDGGGYHHSVTGLGVKMFSAMEYQNRLICNMADKVFAPKVIFKPTSASSNEQLNLVQWGDFGKLPPNFDVVQTPVGSFIEDSLAFHREITGLVASNLSQYNAAQRKTSGNPVTATEAQIDASEQARLGKTQLNHYYQQLDRLYRQKFRRATCPKLNGFKPGGPAAINFQQRCLQRGVPREAFNQIESVHATRIIGQGSQYMRQQALEKMLSTVALWPSESGRNNLLSDFIASLAGQRLVERYNPNIELASTIDDHKALATLQVAATKEGVAPVVSASQNHFVFAETFLVAASQAAQSLQQGANPAEIYGFIDLLGPAIQQHLAYVQRDGTRSQAYQAMLEQWKQLAKVHDQLRQMLEQQAQQQAKNQQDTQRAAAIQNGQDGETQLKQAEVMAKIRMQQQKTQASLQQKQEKHDQAMALNDASTASDIHRKNAIAVSDQRRKVTNEEVDRRSD